MQLSAEYSRISVCTVQEQIETSVSPDRVHDAPVCTLMIGAENPVRKVPLNEYVG